MKRATRISLALAIPTITTLATGCVYTREVETVPPAPIVVAPAAPTTTAAYSEGRWELRGDGSAARPYYWVWVPTGTTVVAPAPPAAPGVVVVSTPTQRVITQADGRWQLYGDGSTDRPYVWVWIPRGANPPSPPRVPEAR
jgi:hypothetical protein